MNQPVLLDAMAAQCRPLIEDALTELGRGDGILKQAVAHHLASGGKRLRALLPPWITSNLGGDWRDALELGLGVELVHNGTLVHDDVQDGDAFRRGRPAVWTVFGMPQAVNVGSWLMLEGCQRVLRAPAGHAVVGDLQRALIRVIEGQALEFELQQSMEPTPAGWETMARAKTGALFACAWRLGATAAGETADRIQAFGAYGDAVGVFFQLQDDLLDLLGDKGRDARATDIGEGKISFPVAWAATMAHSDERARLLAIVHAPRAETSREMVDEALGLLHTTGALDASLTRLRHVAADLASSPWSVATPGLIEKVLAPLAHVL
jgi:geranylgeranyl diphosphate synthase type I